MDIQLEIKQLCIQSRLLKKMIYTISAQEIGYTELTSVIGPILTLNQTTLQSAILLSQKKHYRDLIILSRPFLESVINVGFICAEGDDAVLKSKKYAYQKGYRDLFRNFEINGFSIKSNYNDYVAEFEEKMPNQMKEALSEFTTSKGKEINNWTSETAYEKLEKIGKVYGDYVNGLLSFAFFSIYRDVSEIIHNSYYGVRIFAGLQQKDLSAFKDSEEAAKFFGEHQEKLAAFILQQLNISVCALLNLLNQKFELESTKAVFEKSNKALFKYSNQQL